MTKISREDVERLIQEFRDVLKNDFDRFQRRANESADPVEQAKHNGAVWVTNDIRSRLGGLLRDIQELPSEDEG